MELIASLVHDNCTDKREVIKLENRIRRILYVEYENFTLINETLYQYVITSLRTSKLSNQTGNREYPQLNYWRTPRS